MERKTEEIKIRVTKKEKEKLKQLSQSNHETLSEFLLKTSLNAGVSLPCTLPQEIDIWNLLNEIYHKTKRYGSVQLTEEIRALCQNYMTTYKEPKNE